jgi:hypothetical protein
MMSTARPEGSIWESALEAIAMSTSVVLNCVEGNPTRNFWGVLPTYTFPKGGLASTRAKGKSNVSPRASSWRTSANRCAWRLR